MQKRTLCVLLALVVSAATLRAQTVPSGFFDELVVSGLNNPVGMAFTPDGRFFVTEKDVARVLVCNPAGNSSLCGTVPNVAAFGERGLLGVAVDPGWPANPYIYVCYSANPASMRVSRYTINGDVGVPGSLNLTLGDRYDLVTTLPDNAGNHNGGTVRFGIDGMLYASFGDDANSCSAQDPNDGRGVILRMDVSGLPAGPGGPPPIAMLAAAGNPFPAAPSFGPITWTYGLRNPFRFNVDSVTGNLYVADVGAGAFEEVDEVATGGQNMGWPIFEGNAPAGSCPGATGPYVPPLVAISHGEGWASVISFGGRYRNPAGAPFNFGGGYEGDVFYSDYIAGHLRRLQFNGMSWVNPPAVPGQPSAANWGTGFNNVSDAVIGADGAIYYVRNTASGQIRRVRSNANADQIAIVSGQGQVGVAGRALPQPLTVQVTSPQGVPLAGVPVTFAVTGGLTALGPQPVLTDANGFASTTVTLALQAGNPQITAGTPTSVPVVFTATWRGLTINYVASNNLAVVSVRMASPAAPLVLAVDAPVASPYLQTPFGPIWTSVLNPLPGLGLLTGVQTAANGTWFQLFQNLPFTGGLTFLFQAYGVDTPLLPTPQAYLLSNPITVTFN